MKRAFLALALLTAAVAANATESRSSSFYLSQSQPISWSPDGEWIAVEGMTDFGGGVVAARADGSGATALPIDGYRARWSPDGRRIAGTSNPLLSVATPADGSWNVISNRRAESLAWSPDGEKVVYEASLMLFEVRWDGAQQRALTAGQDPAWSPDGAEVAFGRWSWNSCQSVVAIIGSDGTGERTLASGPQGRVRPVWSPDGTRLAYGGECTDSIFVINRDGSGERVVGHVARDAYYSINSLAWSPDGRWLVVHTLTSTTTTMLEVDGSGRTSFEANRYVGVNWSPRGDRILFSRQTDSGDQLFVGSTDGSERVIGPGSSGDWSPDGTTIAVVRRLDRRETPYAWCVEQLQVIDLSGQVLAGVTPCRHGGTRGADLISGTPGPDYMFGGGGADRIAGGRGDDRLRGEKGDDRLYGGPGRDKVEAGPGEDRIGVRDGTFDRVWCGSGRDVVWADTIDWVARSCESVRRR